MSEILKKVNINKLPAAAKSIYNELKEKTDNFEADLVEVWDEEIKAFEKVLEEKFPKAIGTYKSSPRPKSQGKKNWQSDVKKVQEELGSTWKEALKEWQKRKNKTKQIPKKAKKTIRDLINELKDDPRYKGALSEKDIDKLPRSKSTRKRNLEKDAKEPAKEPIKRKSPTYGKPNGAKKPFYYEYRMNRRDIDRKIMLAHGGPVTEDRKTRIPLAQKSQFKKLLKDTDAEYLAPYEVVSIKLKNGVVIDNLGGGVDVISGFHYKPTGVVTKDVELIDPQQMTLFKKGGAIDSVVYIPRYEIEEIETDLDGVIKGNRLYSGITYDRKSQLDKENQLLKEIGYKRSGDKIIPIKKAKGGSIPSDTKKKIKIVNEGVKFDKSKYAGILGDFDNDGIQNIDDKSPLDNTKTGKVEPSSRANTFTDILALKADLDKSMHQAVEKINKKVPSGADIYARTKTPFSIMDKLVQKRLVNPKKGLTDLIGTTIAVDDYDDLITTRNNIRKGALGEVLEEEDMYKTPKGGYMAYHYIIQMNGYPVEVQLKTKRQKELGKHSHKMYKKQTLSEEGNLLLSKLANDADKGKQFAKTAFKSLMKDTKKVEEILSGKRKP